MELATGTMLLKRAAATGRGGTKGKKARADDPASTHHVYTYHHQPFSRVITILVFFLTNFES